MVSRVWVIFLLGLLLVAGSVSGVSSGVSDPCARSLASALGAGFALWWVGLGSAVACLGSTSSRSTSSSDSLSRIVSLIPFFSHFQSEKFRVRIFVSLLAVILSPFIPMTTIGTGSYRGVVLCLLTCLQSTWSPILILTPVVCLFSSAYSFILAFLSLSRLRTASSSGWSDCLLVSGSFPRSSRPNMSLFGLFPVVGCAVALYALIPLLISSPTGLPSIEAILALFLILCMNLSTSPLASGHLGVTLLWWNPSSSAYSWNAWPLNGGPLSDLILVGTPNVSNTRLNMGMVALSPVDPRIRRPGIVSIGSRRQGIGRHSPLVHRSRHWLCATARQGARSSWAARGVFLGCWPGMRYRWIRTSHIANPSPETIRVPSAAASCTLGLAGLHVRFRSPSAWAWWVPRFCTLSISTRRLSRAQGKRSCIPGCLPSALSLAMNESHGSSFPCLMHRNLCMLYNWFCDSLNFVFNAAMGHIQIRSRMTFFGTYELSVARGNRNH